MTPATIIMICLTVASSGARRILDGKSAAARGSSVKRHSFSMADEMQTSSAADAAAEAIAAAAPSQKGLRGDAAGPPSSANGDEREWFEQQQQQTMMEEVGDESSSDDGEWFEAPIQRFSPPPGLPEALAALARTKWVCEEEQWEGSQHKNLTFNDATKSVQVEAGNEIEIEMSSKFEDTNFKCHLFDTGIVDLLWTQNLPDHETNGAGNSQSARIRVEYAPERPDNCKVTIVRQKQNAESFFVGLVADERKETFVGDCIRP